jgi:hypothetical protein
MIWARAQVQGNGLRSSDRCANFELRRRSDVLENTAVYQM